MNEGSTSKPVSPGTSPFPDPAKLFTPLAQVVRRFNVVGTEASGDSFLYASYVVEAAIKTIAITLWAALEEVSHEHAYRLGHALVRADGLGGWESAIRDAAGAPLQGLYSPQLRPLLNWLTKRRTQAEDEWAREAFAAAGRVIAELGLEKTEAARGITVLHLLHELVEIRNKTKAHGAPGADYFAVVNEPYARAAGAVLATCPAFGWDWVHFAPNTSGKLRGTWLKGDPRPMEDADSVARLALLSPRSPGVFLRPDGAPRFYLVGELLRVNRECSVFRFPNGGMDGREAEFIDYGGLAKPSKEDVSTFVAPPVSLPPSETEGLASLAILAEVHSNLPPLTAGYVHRRALEKELSTLLLDARNPVITLRGAGGVGKTSLAIKVARDVAEPKKPVFETILWFSARDVDLRPRGPSPVRQAVVDLKSIAKTHAQIAGGEGSEEALAKALQIPDEISGRGKLFVFDNFETLRELEGVYTFLNTHIRLPNKILITSRERPFKADYPVEVSGMEMSEATEMLANVGRELGMAHLFTEEVVRQVHKDVDGHAYLMRVVAGGIALAKRYIPAKAVLARREDIFTAIFESSFKSLSPAGRWTFLTVAGAGASVPKLALLVVLATRGVDVEKGLEECLCLSLLEEGVLHDGEESYAAAQPAREFGRKKLESDPDSIEIREDLALISRFGVATPGRPVREGHDAAVRQFIEHAFRAAEASREKRARLDQVLESIAHLWPPAWLDLARFRKQFDPDKARVDEAYRAGVEAMPMSKQAWRARAFHAEETGDDKLVVQCLVKAVDADPTDVDLLREVAFQLKRYFDRHKEEVPVHRRGLYLATVRDHMKKVADRLDAKGLARLGWLFLLENNEEKAFDYAGRGIKKDPSCKECKVILAKRKVGRS